MIEKILITSFCVFAIWYTMQPGEIFGFVQDWFAPLTPKLKDPIFDCAACMSPWWGSGVYWLVWGLWLKTACWQEWLLTVICTIGFNAIIINLWPPSPPSK